MLVVDFDLWYNSLNRMLKGLKWKLWKWPLWQKKIFLNYLNIHRVDLRDRFGVVKIGLFGSFVRGEQKADSDIDLAVEIEKDKKIFILFLA